MKPTLYRSLRGKCLNRNYIQRRSRMTRRIRTQAAVIWHSAQIIRGPSARFLNLLVISAPIMAVAMITFFQCLDGNFLPLYFLLVLARDTTGCLWSFTVYHLLAAEDPESSCRQALCVCFDEKRDVDCTVVQAQYVTTEGFRLVIMEIDTAHYSCLN